MKDYLADYKHLPKLGQETKARSTKGAWWLKQRNERDMRKNLYYPNNMPVGRPSKSTVRSIRRKSGKLLRDKWANYDSGWHATGNNQGVGY